MREIAGTMTLGGNVALGWLVLARTPLWDGSAAGGALAAVALVVLAAAAGRAVYGPVWAWGALPAVGVLAGVWVGFAALLWFTFASLAALGAFVQSTVAVAGAPAPARTPGPEAADGVVDVQADAA
jgi:hypothetical protein